MIYFTTFTLTLILSHVARATPACGDVAPSEELYGPTYAGYADGQHTVPSVQPPSLFNVTHSTYYDLDLGLTRNVACNDGPHGLARDFPRFRDFPNFPFIGGAVNVEHGSPNCGTCWALTYLKNQRTINVTLINSAEGGFNISDVAFEVLSGEKADIWLEAEAKMTSENPCGLP